jgi:hypothetical protein
MKDEEFVDIKNNQIISEPNDAPINRPSTYELLVRQSKKMGGVATKTYQDVRTILNQEIALPQPTQFIRNVSRIARVKPKNSKKVHVSSTSVEGIDELKKRVKQSHEVLAAARTVFPITLFPHDIIMDRTKITIIKRDFFWSSRVISVQIHDILNVSANIGPIFGSLTISSRVMNSVDHFEVNFLWRGDAIQIKQIIHGYVIAKQSKIDTDHLSREEIVDMLRDLGNDTDKR